MPPWFVFLDVDDTLYDFETTFGEALGIVHRDHEIEVPLETFITTYRESSWTIPNAWDLIVEDLNLYRRTVFEAVNEHLDIPHHPTLLSEALEVAREETFRPKDGHEDALDHLASLAEIGVITNGPPDLQRQKIAWLGLDRWAPPHRTIVSGETPWHKPDPRIFRMAQARAGAPSDRCIMIGDRPDKDGGCTLAGWQYVRVTPATPWEEVLRTVEDLMGRSGAGATADA